jgi:hypothetical protein
VILRAGAHHGPLTPQVIAPTRVHSKSAVGGPGKESSRDGPGISEKIDLNCRGRHGTAAVKGREDKFGP